MSEMNEKLVFDRPENVIDRPTHYCPGCHHGIAHRLIGELMDEMDLGGKTLMATSIGCSVFLYNYLNADAVESPHGRAPAVATGLKRARPDSFVFTYQGEKISVVFVNNTVYGMTGGQMAPTTMLSQVTTTTPSGRCQTHEGMPIRMTEIMATLGGVSYAARGSLDSVKNIRKSKKYLRKAFEFQANGTGFGFVELLSGCPTNWKMTALQANERIQNEMIPYFPLGVYKDVSEEGGVC